ncbi:restriction endonuclease subunit S [Heliomicrobium modesticaldum]|nr:restriction endonuclease subunit S [Heliomicrobium modesticaldum]
MSSYIEKALHTLYQRGITSREQLLTELLRVKLTCQAIDAATNKATFEDKQRLFQQMKKSTEAELGYFPGDRDFFADLFDLCKDIDLIEYTLEIYNSDRLGVIISPPELTAFIDTLIDEKRPETILITEAEKHLAGLRALVDRHPEQEITLTTAYRHMYLLLTFALQEAKHVTVFHQSVYRKLLLPKTYDLIYCLPAFGGKGDDLGGPYLTNQTDGIALENTLPLLNDYGVLLAIVPARFTFAGGGFSALRKHIVQHHAVESIYSLPEGTFRPYSAVKSYLIAISKAPLDSVAVGSVDFDQAAFVRREQKRIAHAELLNLDDWRMELLAEEDENLSRYKHSALPRVKLKDMAEVFRGKSVLKKDIKPGRIAVLNISNIDDGEINYTDLETIDEEERKVKRYELVDGDLVLTCRGTTIKVAIFRQQDRLIIASANVIVIRPQKEVLSEYIKLFFESPVGTSLIKSYQRGTTIMNLNHSDIAEMEIPLAPLEQQRQMIDAYRREQTLYRQALQQAEQRWREAREDIYAKMI